MTTPSAIATIEARICDEPYDWEAWSVYGDHLCDIGDPRGELIRSVDLGDAARDHRVALEQDLVIEANLDSRVDAQTVENGFVMAGSLRLASEADVLDLAGYLEAPYARLLRELTVQIDPDIPGPALARLRELPLARLRELRLAEQPRGDEVLGSLVGACTRLVELDCRGVGLTDAGVSALVGLASAGTLRRLHLQRNRIGGEGVARLAPALAGLVLLDLRDNDIGRTGLQGLADAPALGRLRTLRLQLDTFDVQDLQLLADSSTLPHAIVRYVRGVLEQRRKGR